MKNPDMEIELQVSRLIDYLSGSLADNSVQAVGHLHQQLLTSVNQLMAPLYPNQENVDYISSQAVILQIQDKESGRVYTRQLPMDYRENSNGLTLEGEDTSGQPSQIVFLSDTGIDKINDVTGQGRNVPRCDHKD